MRTVVRFAAQPQQTLIASLAPLTEPRGAQGNRRVFLECTSIRASRYATGIQRAGRNLVNASLTVVGNWACTAIVHNGSYFEAIDGLLAKAPSTSRTPTVVDRLRRAFHRVRAGALHVAPSSAVRTVLYSRRFEYALRRMVHGVQGAHRRASAIGAHKASRIDFRRGDVLVLLDPVGNIDLSSEVRHACAAGVEVWVVIYDLIPLAFPDLAPEGSTILMDKRLRGLLPHTFGMLCISRTVADDLRVHLEKNANGLRPYIDYFYLGAGLDLIAVNPHDLGAVTDAFDNAGATVYLTVGTIEPRKNHEMLLNAFDRLWAEGGQARLVIFGRLGWRSEALARSIRAHPEIGKRLFWFETGTDAELDYAYRHASALIFASRCEGFGLPLVEAMQYGLPVLASDIPVFREIAGDYPVYFDVDAAQSLDHELHRMEATAAAGSLARLAPNTWLTWADSARMLLDKASGAAPASQAAQSGAQLAPKR